MANASSPSGAVRRHRRPVAVTASGTRPEGRSRRAELGPNELNVRVCVPPSARRRHEAAVPVPASPSRDRRHVVWPTRRRPRWSRSASRQSGPAAADDRRPCRERPDARRPPSRASTARRTIATATAMNTEPWTWAEADVTQPERVALLAQPDVRATGGPQRAQPWVGSTEVGPAAGSRLGRGHAPMVPRNDGEPRAGRTSADRIDQRVDVLGRPGETIAPSAPASRQRSQVSRGSGHPRRVGTSSRPSQLALEPDDDRLVLARAGRRQRFEVDAAGSPRSCRRTCPAVADPRRQPRAGGSPRRR